MKFAIVLILGSFILIMIIIFLGFLTSPFSNTAFILFLNKKDLFEEKIKRVDLKVCFPNYQGLLYFVSFFSTKSSSIFFSFYPSHFILFSGGGDFETAAGFIKKQFLDHSNAPHMVFPHYTCAIDTSHLRAIWEAGLFLFLLLSFVFRK